MILSFFKLFVCVLFLSQNQLFALENTSKFYLVYHKPNPTLSLAVGRLTLVKNLRSEIFLGETNPFQVIEEELQKNNFDLGDLFYELTLVWNNQHEVTDSLVDGKFSFLNADLYEIALTDQELPRFDAYFESKEKDQSKYFLHRSQKNSTTQIRDFLFETLQLSLPITLPNGESRKQYTVFETEVDCIEEEIQKNGYVYTIDPNLLKKFESERVGAMGIFLGFPEKIYSKTEFIKLLDNMRFQLKRYMPDSDLTNAFEDYYFSENMRKKKLGAYDLLFTPKRLLDALTEIAHDKIKRYEQKNDNTQKIPLP